VGRGQWNVDDSREPKSTWTDMVEGDPSKRVGDPRNTRTVMMDGKLMDADALRTASGFSGRPVAHQ
jgi:hypothetical protein